MWPVQSSSYSFETHIKSDQLRLLDIETGETTIIFESSNRKDPVWIDEREILLFDHGNSGDGSTMIMHLDLANGW